ncbi:MULTISPECIES: outer membrane protein assembly factor BamB [unclassified Acinetobacter]|uniref:outer membrane protein assembly factor BamB n=1 Tax=unclassified Acinetobacter TaxID=196816 RepID=UPI0035B9AD0E
MKQLLKVPFALTVLSVALVGCSSLNFLNKSNTEEVVKPNPLPKIVASTQLTPVFKTSTSSLPKFDVLKLQMVQENGIYYRIDAKGEVSALQGRRTVWSSKIGKSLSSGVAVGEGVVVVGNQQGELFALDATTGKQIWTQKLGAALLSPSLIQQGRVVTVGNDGKVYAHDLRSGQVLWTFDLPSNNLAMRGYASPVLLSKRTVLLASSNAYVYAVDLMSGTPVWQRRVAFNEGRGDIQRLIDIDGEPVISNGKMVTVSYQGMVTVIDLDNEQVLWSNKSSSLNRPAADIRAVYVAQTDGTLNAYDVNTGASLWTNTELLNRKLSNPVRIGQHLVVGDYEGVLHLVDPATGKLTGRASTSGQVRTLNVQNNQLFVATDKGEFSVWQPK